MVHPRVSCIHNEAILPQLFTDCKSFSASKEHFRIRACDCKLGAAGKMKKAMEGLALSIVCDIINKVKKTANYSIYREEVLAMRIVDIADAVLSDAARRRDGRAPFLIAVDGRCAAGKSTLAHELARRSGCVVLPMDHFFLRPEQRTEERFREPGGNVDRERFLSEALLPLCAGAPFSYRPFDCRTLSLAAPVSVAPAELCVVEGSYSCHPALREHYDLTVFLDVSPDEQLRRIRARNGLDGARRFADRWIPLEERYFSACSVREHCTLYFLSE